MNRDNFNYDALTDSQKQKLKEMALSLGYKIEGTTNDEVRKFYREILKRDEDLRKNN